MSGAASRALRFGPYRVETSHEERILFPGDGITKGGLIRYYRRVAEHALPHLRGRPLTLHRYPEGIAEAGFVQQTAPAHFPDWVRRIRVERREGGATDRVACENAATLAYLANQGCVELHAWASRSRDLGRPDLLIFDLDPSTRDFRPVRDGALRLRELLEGLGLVPFVKTTGSRGLHVTVPLRPGAGFDGVREFSQGVAGLLVAREPRRFTLEQRKAKRGDRVFVDTFRNAWGQTAVAPYSLRARPGAPVATPLEWEELDDPGLRADRFTLDNVFRRLARRRDPWWGLARRARSLEGPARRLAELTRAASDA